MPPPRSPAFELGTLWQRAREPVFWLDAELRLTWVNPAWESLTGFAASAVIGLTCQAHAPSQAGDLSDLAASFHPPPETLAGQAAGAPTLIFRADGERLWRRVEFWPFGDEQGGRIGMLGIVRADRGEASVPESQAGRLHAELLEMRRRLLVQHGLDALIGSGPGHRRLVEQVRLAADSSVPVLIVGEPGTGKRQVARTIHQQGPHRNRPFIAFDCQALPAEILERELFAPTDPESPGGGTRRARLSLGDGSTLLIDDVLSLPQDLQARLIEALDSRVRLMATAACEPEVAVRDERLRAELYYSLTALVLHVSPLRDRRDELPALAQNFLERINQRGGPQRAAFEATAIEALAAYDWPGNLPELARVVEHAHAGARGHLVTVDDLPASIRGNLGGAYAPPPMPATVKPLDAMLTEFERRLIETALRQARGNKSRAAELLDISRPRLYRRIKELDLPDEDEPGANNGTPGASAARPSG
jgi:PAS domain S-box-containing protein